MFGIDLFGYNRKSCFEGGFMHQELNAIVLPNGSMEMEWTDIGEQLSKSQNLLQQEIYRRFVLDAETAFLFLGFCDRTVPYPRLSNSGENLQACSLKSLG